MELESPVQVAAKCAQRVHLGGEQTPPESPWLGGEIGFFQSLFSVFWAKWE